MRIFERVLWVIIALAVMMKLLHLPLANFLLIIGFSTAAMLYSWLGWLIFPSPTRKDQHIGLTILTSLALMFLITGVLFKIQAWPNATSLVVLGISLSTLSILLAWLHHRKHPERKRYVRNMLLRCVPLMCAALLLYPINSSRMMRFHHRGESEAKLKLYDKLYGTDDLREKESIQLKLDSLEEADILDHLQH